jgi:hypothetical protein
MPVLDGVAKNAARNQENLGHRGPEEISRVVLNRAQRLAWVLALARGQPYNSDILTAESARGLPKAKEVPQSGKATSLTGLERLPR